MRTFTPVLRLFSKVMRFFSKIRVCFWDFFQKNWDFFQKSDPWEKSWKKACYMTPIKLVLISWGQQKKWIWIDNDGYNKEILPSYKMHLSWSNKEDWRKNGVKISTVKRGKLNPFPMDQSDIATDRFVFWGLVHF